MGPLMESPGDCPVSCATTCARGCHVYSRLRRQFRSHHERPHRHHPAGLVAFDHIIVAVLTNASKQPLFNIDDRIKMIRDALPGDERVEVDHFERGLLVDYARSKGVNVILRGLRAAGDFEYELQMANMNRHLSPGIETVFIGAAAFAFVSSSLIKEAAALGGDVRGVVPELVHLMLKQKFTVGNAGSIRPAL